MTTMSSTVRKAAPKKVAARRVAKPTPPSENCDPTDGLRLVAQKGEPNPYVVEIWAEPPQYRMVYFVKNMYQIATPWVYYRLIANHPSIKGFRQLFTIFGSVHEVTDFDDTKSLIRLPLPNLVRYERPCFRGIQGVDIATLNQMTPEQYVRHLIAAYWESGFNWDYTNRIWSPPALAKSWKVPDKDTPGLFTAWEKLSLDALADQKWCPLGASITSLLNIEVPKWTDRWAMPVEGYGRPPRTTPSSRARATRTDS